MGNKKYKIISWNVNGIRACVKKGFKDFLIAENADIFGLQEIKISASAREKEIFDFINYQEFWHSAEKPGYSGTATLVQDNLKVLNDFSSSQKEIFDNEGRVQTIEFEDFYFLNIYFPNSGGELDRLSFKEEFNKEFLKYALELEKKKPLIICGDFNVAHEDIDLKNPKENKNNAGFTPQERYWMDEFLKSGFVDTFRYLHPEKIKYSWWSYRFHAREKGIGWRIDYFLISKSLIKNLQAAFILDSMKGSDHAPVGIEIVF